jgi:hypothetical protein
MLYALLEVAHLHTKDPTGSQDGALASQSSAGDKKSLTFLKKAPKNRVRKEHGEILEQSKGQIYLLFPL